MKISVEKIECKIIEGRFLFECILYLLINLDLGVIYDAVSKMTLLIYFPEMCHIISDLH